MPERASLYSEKTVLSLYDIETTLAPLMFQDILEREAGIAWGSPGLKRLSAKPIFFSQSVQTKKETLLTRPPAPSHD